MPKESIIKHFSSSTTGNVPSSGDLVEGELAINTADEKVFFKNLAGNVVSLGASKDISGSYSAKGHTHGISDISNATTVGSSFVTLANPSELTYPVINADNTVSALTADAYRRSIGVIIPVTVGTAAATAAKVGTTQFGNDVPVVGDTFAVTFTLGNSVSTATLAIDGTTARNIRLNNANVNTSTFSLNAGATVIMYFDGTYYQVVGSQDVSDDYDIYSLRTYSTQVGESTTRYKWLMEGTDGKIYPISIGDTTATTKTVSTVEFKINSNVFYYYGTDTLAADSNTTAFYTEGLCNTQYAFNQTTWTLYRPVYLVGTVNSNGNFVLDNSTSTSYFTQTLPSTEDGKLYIHVGIPYANTAMKLFQYHPIYEYKNGRIRQYVPNLQGDDITSGTIANARTTATASNVNDAIVARDGSGNFSAGTITANLSGSATQLGGTAANSWALQSWVTSGLNTKANTSGTNATGTWPINITGNASTATSAATLTTARSINGTSFNGGSDITTANWGTSRNITIGDSTQSVNGSTNITYTAVGIGATSTNTANKIVMRDSSGNFSAGTITANLSGSATQLGGTAANSWALLSSIGNGTLTLNVSGVGLAGSQTFTANQSGNATFTVTSNATNANTASTIVSRDGSGNFSAGTITASLNGNASTATSAATLTTARSINGTSFNGGSDITTANWGTSRTITIGDTGKSVNGSGNVTWTAVEIGATSANTANKIVMRDVAGDFTGRYINAQYFNHSHSAAYRGSDTQFYSSTDNYIRKNTKEGFLASLGLTNTASANTAGAIVVRDGSGNFSAGTITASLAGNASTATSAATLTTARSINGTSFNGGSDITTANWGTSRTITIGDTGKSVNGSGNVSWSFSEIGAVSTNTANKIVLRDGSGNFSAGTATLGALTVDTNTLHVDAANDRVGIGTTTPGYKLEVNGSFAATTKSFVIPHPTQEGMTLRHGSLEGPENGVYVRGRAHGHTITLPHYWTGLVDEETITVQLTPFGKPQNLWVESVSIGSIGVSGCDDPSYFYTVYGERKDVARLKVEE